MAVGGGGEGGGAEEGTVAAAVEEDEDLMAVRVEDRRPWDRRARARRCFNAIVLACGFE